MISKDNGDKLVRISFFICEKFEELRYYCERFSNNNQPELTDQEIMTIYLYVMHQQGHFKVKHIHRFAWEYLRSWFPKLGSYQAFKLNRLAGAFDRLVEILLTDFRPEDCCLNQSLLDSMQIITCLGKGTGKVAREITNKGYCSTKGMYVLLWDENAPSWLSSDWQTAPPGANRVDPGFRKRPECIQTGLV